MRHVYYILYQGALLYKKRLATDVYAVRFRFQASFDTLMVMTRTRTSPCFSINGSRYDMLL